MKTIYKYPIEVTNEQTIKLPKGAKILTIQTQRETPCIWAMIDKTEQETEEVELRVHGTGHDVPDSETLRYIGTFQLHGGSLVFHTFRKV
ncbi:MAG: DUF7352 domain-containing protein [Bacteroidales bacterium]